MLRYKHTLVMMATLRSNNCDSLTDDQRNTIRISLWLSRAEFHYHPRGISTKEYQHDGKIESVQITMDGAIGRLSRVDV